MFVSNKTDFECVLARGLLTDQSAVLSVNFEVRYSIADDGSLTLAEPIPRQPTGPPDIRPIVLWRGTSVTASGTVYGPSKPPYQRPVSLAVDGTEHRLMVFGPRRWIREGNSLVPSQPEAFDALPLSWEHAFGGEYELPPGAVPDSGLPHPGGRVVYPYNPKGVGFYADERAAEGQPLPQIEQADRVVNRSADRPQPGGFSPCLHSPALRLEEPGPQGEQVDPPERVALVRSWSEKLGPKVVHTAVRLQHHAPAPLIFPWLDPGTELRVEGMGRRRLDATAPTLPLGVVVRRGKQSTNIRCRLRSLHIDTNRHEVLAAFGFSHRHDACAAPQWITVNREAATQ